MKVKPAPRPDRSPNDRAPRLVLSDRRQRPGGL